MSDTQGVAETGASPARSSGPALTCGPWADLTDLPEGCPCRTVAWRFSRTDDDRPYRLVDQPTIWLALQGVPIYVGT